MPPNRPPTRVRVSALTNYPDCNRRGAARLFRQEILDAGFTLQRGRRGIGAVVGTAVHKAAAVTLTEKAKTGTLPPLPMALDIARDQIVDQLAAGEVHFDGPNGATPGQRDAMRQAIAMAQSYHLIVAPEVHPVLVEEHLEAEVEPGLVLTGHPDLVAREPGAVRDLKTGVKAPASYAPQLGGYSLLSRSHGLEIDHAAIDFVQRVKGKRPQPDPITKRVRVAEAETAAANILRHIAADIATFRHGDPARRIQPGDPWAFQANPSSFLCSAKFCPAWGTDFCREGDPNREEALP